MSSLIQMWLDGDRAGMAAMACCDECCAPPAHEPDDPDCVCDYCLAMED